jgi:hypothetical protein
MKKLLRITYYHFHEFIWFELFQLQAEVIVLNVDQVIEKAKFEKQIAVCLF